jgi:hypothetical protein
VEVLVVVVVMVVVVVDDGRGGTWAYIGREGCAWHGRTGPNSEGCGSSINWMFLGVYPHVSML